MQARFLTEEQAVHAEDWSYAIITVAHPQANEAIGVFLSDPWYPDMNVPGMADEEFEQGDAIQWLHQAHRDGLSRDAL
jgi:hypothetical protein